MQRFAELEPVLAAYPADCQPGAVECLGAAGGFSGARIWRVTAPRGLLCLRRWPPESPDESRLRWLQAIVAHAEAHGFRLLPTVIPTCRGGGFVGHGGYLWELTTWLSGNADYWTDPRPEKLKAAMAALAQFHRAVESFPLLCGESPPLDVLRSRRAPSPGIAERLALVGRLRAGAITQMRAEVDRQRSEMPALAHRAERIFELVSPHLGALGQELHAVSRIEMPLQPCLRDIWHNHVLFEGVQVSGLVDVGSMRLNTVGTDIARLLGSLCGNDRDGWITGLEAYEAVRPLDADERMLVGVFDRSQMMLAGVKWVEWVFVEGRIFSDPSAVIERMEHILTRLRCASFNAFGD